MQSENSHERPSTNDGPRRRAVELSGWALVTLTILVLLYPLIGLGVPVGPWQWRGGAPGSTAAALRVSISLTGIALLIVVLFGTPIAWYLARSRGLRRRLLEGAVLISVLMPPLALGLLLSLALSPRLALGRWLVVVGMPMSNSAPAFVVTQVYAAIGYYVIAARAAFEQAPRELEDVAALLGAGPWRVFWDVTFPLARLGLAAALSLAWVRAIGEFGAVVITAYYPAGIPVQLWVDLQDSGLPSVMPLLVIFLLTALPLPWLMQLFARRPRHARG
ncbi:MAG: ABC transporter permease subunit [Acidiferrobacteraceae bacterium]